MTTEKKWKLLKKWEKFWILNLKTLYQDGLNQELNFIYVYIYVYMYIYIYIYTHTYTHTHTYTYMLHKIDE